MPPKNLSEKIHAAGDVVRMLRSAGAGYYEFPYPSQYTDWRDEQEAARTTAVMFDMGRHMTDLYLRGPDVYRLLADTGINSFASFGKNKAKQFVACSQDGHVVGDAILFGLEDDEVNLVGNPMAPNWVGYHADTGDYDVEVVRDTRVVENKGRRRTFRYQIQGPNSQAIVERAYGKPLPQIKFFHIGEFTVGGCPVRALNHTMTGIPGLETTGLEIWGPIDQGPTVLQALLEAGTEFGLRQGGSSALITAGLESGWLGLFVPAIYSGEHLEPYRRHLSADGFEASASLGGSFSPDDIEQYYLTPWDLGYGRLIKFDHEFIGRPALEKLVDQPHRRMVWLRWNDADATRVYADSLFNGRRHAKYMTVPNAAYATFQYDQVVSDDRPIGLSTRVGYTGNVGGWSSLAILDEEIVRDGAEVTVVWGEADGGSANPMVEQHVQTEVRATISTSPLV
jgi:vanillate/3-O-methylgallate O-demethylase